MTIRTNNDNIVFENDRVTDNFDIFFWIFHDSKGYTAPHWHNAIEITYNIKGEIYITFENKEVKLFPGDIFLIDSKVPHSIRNPKGNHAILIQLPFDFLKKYIPDIDIYEFHFDCHTNDQILRTKINRLIEVIQQMQIVFEVRPEGSILRFNSLLFELLFQLYHNFARPVETKQISQNIKKYTRLEPVLNYSNDHYNEHITLTEIAKLACMQEVYFCHYFKKCMGMTYFQYLNEIRLSHIYHDLQKTDDSISHLLDKHGFSNYKLFRNLFFEKFNMTPGEYRKTYKES